MIELYERNAERFYENSHTAGSFASNMDYIKILVAALTLVFVLYYLFR